MSHGNPDHMATDDAESELRELFHRFHQLEDERRANGYDVSKHVGSPEQRVVDLRLAAEEAAVEQRIIDLQRSRQHTVARSG